MTPTVYIKLPVNREGFIDPPNLNWTENKEEKLWQVISKSKKTDVDWNDLSRHFEVPISFLQWRAFGLYEVELEQLRKKIKRTSFDQETTNHSSRVTSDIGSTNMIRQGSESNCLPTASTMIRQVSFTEIPAFNSPSVSQVLTSAKSDSNGMKKFKQSEEEEEDNSSDIRSLESDEDNEDHMLAGSALLYRSRIFSKKPSIIRRSVLEEQSSEEEENDTDDSETVALVNPEISGLRRNHQSNNEQDDDIVTDNSTIRQKTTVHDQSRNLIRHGSNFSNIEGSITREDLEEALLNNSHF